MSSLWKKVKKRLLYVNFTHDKNSNDSDNDNDNDKGNEKYREKHNNSYREKKGIFQYADYKLFILALLGILLMLFGSFFSSTEPRGLLSRGEEELSPQEIQYQGQDKVSPEKKLQESLEEVLSHVQGVSNPSVFINFNSGTQKVFASDFEENLKETQEQDNEGGVRDTTELNKRAEIVIKRGSQGEEIPLIIEEIYPQIQGVLVVAEGVENPNRKSQILDAVKAVLDLPPHRVVVLPRDRGN